MIIVGSLEFIPIHREPRAQSLFREKQAFSFMIIVGSLEFIPIHREPREVILTEANDSGVFYISFSFDFPG
jgi:hypothetical protein